MGQTGHRFHQLLFSCGFWPEAWIARPLPALTASTPPFTGAGMVGGITVGGGGVIGGGEERHRGRVA